ncbi:MAG: phenylphosphate carboxylase subunit delta [Xanthomonadales bacterium]|nr:phenylphosphate carboxylase subunit delta [Xanthomonadales bacterium]
MAIWSDDALARARDIGLLGLDVDGTLTDGRLWIAAGGEQFKAFHVQDGLGLKLLRQQGIHVVWITARRSAIVAARAAELGIEDVIQGCRDKREALAERCAARRLDLQRAAFMGDDLPDLPAMTSCRLAAAPCNAHTEVAARAHWQSDRAGGEGAVRQLCDGLLVAQGKFDQAMGAYLS